MVHHLFGAAIGVHPAVDPVHEFQCGGEVLSILSKKFRIFFNFKSQCLKGLGIVGVVGTFVVVGIVAGIVVHGDAVE
jgi:hypothetical protein